jgi:hypothetical protein
VATDVLRQDNRVVLTYLPELPPAETAVESVENAADREDQVAA